jgi:lysophospholipase L1-like esterase
MEPHHWSWRSWWRPPSARGLLFAAVVLVLTCGALAVVKPAGAAVTASVPDVPGPAVGWSSEPAGLVDPARIGGAAPVLAVVGASFAAGVGAAGPHMGWPYLLARLEGWRVIVSADPGAGFLNPGAHRLGPLARLVGRLDLARLNPSMVIVQGGYNDVGRSPAAVASQVAALFGSIRRSAPHARLGLVSVFSVGAGPTRTAVALDRTIIAAARKADPAVVVFDPLAERWVFPRIGDDLHPSPAGHAWIAARIEQDLRR